MRNAFAFFIVLLNTRVSGEATVDRKNNTCDKACSLVREEEEQTADKLGGIAESSHGSAVQNLVCSRGGGAVRIEEKCTVLVRNEEAGRYCINSYVCIRKVNAEPLSKVRNSGLCSTVRRNLSKGAECIHR